MTLNSVIRTAEHSLEIFTAGIQVAGQNVSNANTPGYIREELNLVAGDSYRKGDLIFGTGVRAEGIVQQIDKFLETRIHAANGDVSASAAREAIYKQLEAEIRELGDSDLSTSLSNFLAAIHDVVNQPESAPLRQLMLQQGQQFAGDVANLRYRLDNLRARQTVAIDSLVKEANTLIQKIHNLNPQIVQLEAGGTIPSDAGALRSQRYDALNRLSQIIPIKFTERKDGSVEVFTNNDTLILGSMVQTLETIPAVDRGVQVQTVRLSKTHSLILQNATGGELKGIVDGRDQILGGFVDELDRYAAAVIGEFNRIHSSGEGLIGFDSVTATNAVDNTTAALNAAGLDFPPQHGSFQLKVTNKISGLTETTTINVDLDGIGSDTSLEDLRAALDAVDNVSATITPKGFLQIDAGSDYELTFSGDTSGVLASLGINTFFTGHDSTTIGINPAVAADHRLLATGQGGGPSDSRNVELLADFNRTPLASLDGLGLTEFYEETVSSVAQQSASETAVTDGLRTFQQSLLNQREQFSGVSLDEEAVKVLQFQHSFQAAARLISTVDELFTTLLQL